MAGHLNLCREKANILLLRDKIECLPDSDPSEGLGLVLSDGESPLSGFRLKPEIKIFSFDNHTSALSMHTNDLVFCDLIYKAI